MCFSLQGTIPGHPHSYTLDSHHTFAAGKWYEVCGSTGEHPMLRLPWRARHAAVTRRQLAFATANLDPARSPPGFQTYQSAPEL